MHRPPRRSSWVDRSPVLRPRRADLAAPGRVVDFTPMVARLQWYEWMSTPRRAGPTQSDQMVVVSPGRRRRPGPDAQLDVDVRQVPGDGLLTEEQPLRDVSVGEPGGGQADHLDLTTREASRRPDGGLGSFIEALEVGLSPELLEHQPGGVVLHLRGSLVSQRPATVADADPDAGGVVRHPQLPPTLPRDAEQRQCVCRG